MRPDFVFRSGKYAGKTYSYVSRVDPRWLRWVEINRPEMLREHGQSKREEPKIRENPKSLDVDEDGETEGRDGWTNLRTFQLVAQRILKEEGF